MLPIASSSWIHLKKTRKILCCQASNASIVHYYINYYYNGSLPHGDGTLPGFLASWMRNILHEMAHLYRGNIRYAPGGRHVRLGRRHCQRTFDAGPDRGWSAELDWGRNWYKNVRANDWSEISCRRWIVALTKTLMVGGTEQATDVKTVFIVACIFKLRRTWWALLLDIGSDVTS